MLAPIFSPEEITQFFNDEVAKARTGELKITQLFGAAEKLSAVNSNRLAAELYKNWIAFNGSHELCYMAYFNLSVILRALDDHAGAINALQASARLKGDFHQAKINLGRVFEDAGNLGKALEAWSGALDGLAAVTAESIKFKLLTLQQMGRVLESAERLEPAENILKQAIELRPDMTDAIQHWISLRQRQCKWPVLAPSEFVSRRQLIEGLSPMSLALHADDPLFQLAKAHRYYKSLVGQPTPLDLTAKAPFSSSRIRIGYVSSDLREHAVGFALVELLELHDKTQFEIFAYYFGPNRSGDLTQGRFRAAVDHWTDITQMDDDAAAAAIADDEIDILVDLNGYTKNARTAIFARRPAPVIVNWCGYPGTMASPDHHYLISDESIIPPSHEIFFSEKVLRLPCNQPLDRKRVIERNGLNRSHEGLPDQAFVYCCLNGMQKITSQIFDLWMDILRHVPGSVLWLLSGGEDVDARLQKLADQRGVAPTRLVFAPKRPNAQHLARMALADLFLDTFPYGAHSTAADALTMGVPVLTRPGRGFAARFCASVVRAAGLDDLVCDNFQDYVRVAIQCGLDGEIFRRHKGKLQAARDKSVLRDMDGAVRRLEALYRQMRVDYASDALPRPDFSNLDLYYEIGASLDLDQINFLDDAAYFQIYRDKLSAMDVRSPLAQDTRLWCTASD